VPVIAVKPDAKVCVAENESAKIADERLYARSDRSRIEVRPVLPPFTATEEPEDFGRVSMANLAEGRLQRDLRFGSRQTSGRVNIDDATPLDAQVVDVDLRRDVDSPVSRFEGGVAVRQVERECEILTEGDLLTLAEQVSGRGPLRVNRTWQPPRVYQRLAF